MVRSTKWWGIASGYHGSTDGRCVLEGRWGESAGGKISLRTTAAHVRAIGLSLDIDNSASTSELFNQTSVVSDGGLYWEAGTTALSGPSRNAVRVSTLVIHRSRCEREMQVQVKSVRRAPSNVINR